MKGYKFLYFNFIILLLDFNIFLFLVLKFTKKLSVFGNILENTIIG